MASLNISFPATTEAKLETLLLERSQESLERSPKSKKRLAQITEYRIVPRAVRDLDQIAHYFPEDTDVELALGYACFVNAALQTSACLTPATHPDIACPPQPII